MKKSLLSLALFGLSTSLMAQQVQTPVQVNDMSQPNVLEREVTPLLREISKKKTTLEIRRLERDIEKLDEEAQKIQDEREKNIRSAAPGGSQVNQSGLYNPVITNVNAPLATPMQQQETTLRVLMIYGFGDDLHAKISFGRQGGYVVKKGDVTPDGRMVVKVNPTHIEVVKADQKKYKNTEVERVFISEAPVNTQQMQQTMSGNNFNQSSTNLSSPSLPPIGNFGGIPSISTR